MITLQAFLDGVTRNVARIKQYQLGGDGSGGSCDCIGLIIGAVRLAGGKWTGTHGSNYAARNEMRTLGRITEPFLGEIVYKAREPGEKGYDLPAKYKTSGDLLDYYHVGVVTSINPLNITHCTSVAGGIKIDTTLGQWEYGGELSKVNYGGNNQMDVLYQAVVTADNSYPVKLRKQPRTNAVIINQIKQGTLVDVLEEQGDWDYISVDGIAGYMMHKFLRKADDYEQLDILNELENIQDQLANLMETVDKLLLYFNVG